MKRFILLFFFLLTCFQLIAQTAMVTGKVQTNKNQPLPGATVMVKETGQGAVTNAAGFYSVACQPTVTLVFSHLGFQTQERPVHDQSAIHITLVPVTPSADTVMTGLGLEKERKALGYPVQQIRGQEVSLTPGHNLLNALSGKLTGMQVSSTSGAPGASARLLIRGIRSLTINNQPLVVVDGMPIDNNNYGSTSATDYGNGAGAIHPNDIASISVLKGAAAALYGSRGANGVILLTSKRGRKQTGIGVEVDSYTSFESPIRLPEYQNSYGQGNLGQFAFKDGKGGGLRDGSAQSWGPPLDGRLLPQFDSPLDANGNRIPTPFVAHPDNWKNFYETGKSLMNQVALTGANEKVDFRLAISDLRTTGTLPNTDYSRRSLTLNSGYQLSPRLKARAAGSLIQDGSDNRVNGGQYASRFGRQVEVEKLKNYWLPNSRDQFNWIYSNWSNPYYVLHESTRANEKYRLLGNIQVDYTISQSLSLLARSGTDISQDNRKNKGARFNATLYSNYGEEEVFARQTNTDVLLDLHPKGRGQFRFSGILGGNLGTNLYKLNNLYAAKLREPNIFSFANSREPVIVQNWKKQKKSSSLYGSGQVAFRDYLFLDLTARRDWSEIGLGDYAYFYPSATMSAVLTDMFHLRSPWLSFAKLRTGFASLGNDPDPFQRYPSFQQEDPWGNFSGPKVLPDGMGLYFNNQLAGASTTREAGLDLLFFGSRLGLDVTYYQQRSKNQFLAIPLDPAASPHVGDIGEISNKGLEIQLNATPLQQPGGLQWQVAINYARNQNRVTLPDLGNHPSTFNLNSFGRLEIVAQTGRPFGLFYGSQFQRAPDGQIIHLDGLPQIADDSRILGDPNPDWIGGMAHTLSYKGFSLYTLLDAKWGGDIFANTVHLGRLTGVLAETASDRETGIIGAGVKNVGSTDQPQYVPNDVRVPAQQYFQTYHDFTNMEAAIFDGTYLKLREARLAYTLPAKLLSKLPVRELTLALTGRNLLLLYSRVPHIDPETSYFGSESNLSGIENGQLPTNRSLGFHISFHL